MPPNDSSRSILVSGVVVDRNMTEHYGNSRESSSSASSLNSSLQVTEDDHAIAKILAEEEEIASRYGGKLAKRLSHLDSIPHTPRVIGQIPDPNDATLDHGRLSSRLAAYGLAEFQIQGDGNCQFRALADQLYHNPEYHKHVRKEVVKQSSYFCDLSANSKLYSNEEVLRFSRFFTNLVFDSSTQIKRKVELYPRKR
ncbi:putative cyanidin-3-O-glucoside 2-O-glucuronosyltransferase-like [Capsicum annuum]|nr:putative cyanidin-3-O-glucoside 2-O-glucuronosyltransferase-like [Capsicum annuum]